MRFRLSLPILAATYLVSASAPAQTPTLVKDIYPGVSATPRLNANLVRALGTSGGRAFLGGSDNHGDAGIWMTDGSIDGTRQLLDLSSTSGADVEGEFFFNTAGPGAIWRTDGTTAGTSLVSRIGTDPSVFTAVSRLTAVGARLFFLAEDGVHGRELWTSDGTAAGTRLVKDLVPGSTGAFDDSELEAQLVDVGGILYFSCGDVWNECGLWRSDGTEAGTLQLASLSGVDSLVNVTGTLYFVAHDPEHGTELWESDGTAAGTVLVRDIVPGAGGSHPNDLVSFAGVLYFKLGSDGSTWKSDGSESGTVLVHTYPGSGPLVPSGDRLFFANGSQLWATDGTVAGTELLRDLGTQISLDTAAPAPGGLLFWVGPVGGDLELWGSDGTPAGTALVEDLGPMGEAYSRPASVSIPGAAILLTGRVPLGLWRSDGTAAGTFPLQEPWLVPNHGLPMYLTDVNGTVLFRAEDAEHGLELWRSDGTPEGTRLVKDIEPGPGGSDPSQVFVTPSAVYLVAHTSASGSEIYRTDGTESGTVLVKEIQPGDTPYARPLGVLGETFLFLADDGTHGEEPWRSDGTPDGTFLLGDLTPGSAWSQVNPVGVLNGEFFLASSDDVSTTLWKTDGTVAGTEAVGPIPSFAWKGGEVGGLLLFTIRDASFRSELWKTDGTADGTGPFIDLYPAGDSSAYVVGRLGGRLVFWVNDGTHGSEPWITDGTTAGTSLVKDINPGPAASGPARPTIAGDALYCFADDGVHGYELWKTDGTPAGTALVRDVAPGPAGSYFQESIAPMGRGVFFTASDHVSGREAWRSDGTAARTTRVADLVPGLGSSAPSWFVGTTRTVPVRSGGRMFFTGTDGATGYELWSLPIPLGFHPVTPCRVADTRDPAGPAGGVPLGASETLILPVTGRCGIPSTAISVAANVTVVNPTATGSLSVFAGGPIVSGTTEVPVTAGKTRALNAIPLLGTAGSLAVRADLPQGGTTHVLLDVSGWFE